MRSQAPDTDDPLLESLRGPDPNGSLAVSLAVALAVVLGVLATTAPVAALAAVALVAGGYLLAGVRRRAREGTGRQRRLCVPRTTVCVEV
ncbi:hypothetical protein HUG10_08145 [Halorarum halophilum]|uniref:Uncharacterized protein n=1 Tax=Halorarum halophilum TaxID=2743090 RepID=A0A7D5GKK6_9EURY|nr:hypothetical protein [Halobaculum halophilum]QLG27524.1 hypothetical protein HUG10_08145 [Halobaculum halophilum]